MEEAAYQPDEEEEFEPRARPDEKPPAPVAPYLEEAPLIPSAEERQAPSQPKIWHVRLQEGAGKKSKNGTAEDEEMQTERTPLMPYPMILRDEDEEEEEAEGEASKCCCLIS